MRRRLLTVLTAVAAALAPIATVSPPAHADTVLRDSRALPMTSYSDHVVDLERGRIYLTPGPGDHRLVVTDLSGAPVRTVEGLTGAEAIALSPDRGSIFVVLETARIVELDAETLEQVRTYPLSPDVHVADVAWAGGRLWLLTSDPYSRTGLSSLDPDTGTETPSDLPVRGPTLAATPDGLRVLAVSQDSRRLLAVGGDGTVSRERGFDNAVLGVETSPTGQVVATFDYPEARLVRLDANTLETVGTTLSSIRYATTDGTRVAASGGYWQPYSVRVLDPDTSEELNHFQIAYDRDDEALRVVDAVLSDQGLVVIAEGADGVSTWHVPDPSAPSSTLSLDVPDGAWIGKETVLSGTLTDGGAPVPGAEVTITDFPGITHDVPDRVRTAVTGPDGTFSVPYTPRAWREVFVVEYAGDGEHLAASEEFGGTFDHQPTLLEVTRPSGVAPGENVTFEGSLTALGDPVVDAPIVVKQFCARSTDPAPVRTDSRGLFRVTVLPGRCLEPYFQFSYDDDSWTYLNSYANRTVPVSWQRSSMTLAQPVESAVVGSTFVWEGTLARDAGALAQAPVSYTLRREFGGVVAEGELRTDSAGDFRVELTVDQADRYVMTATFAGDESTLATSATDSIQTTRVPTSLQLDEMDLRPAPDAPVVFSGTVSTVDGQPMAGRDVEIRLGDEVVAPLRTDAEGRFRYETTPEPKRDWWDNAQRTYYVDVLETPTYAAAQRHVTLIVEPAPTRLVLDDIPSPVTSGDRVTFSGRLTTEEGEPLAEREITFQHQDGNERVFSATTDADGRFSAERVIQTGQNQYLVASFAGTRHLAPVSASRNFQSSARRGVLTLEAVGPRLLGETVHMNGRLTTVDGEPAKSWITVTRTGERGDITYRSDPIPTASDGSFSVQLPAHRVGRFTFTASSVLWEVSPQTASTVVDVRRLALSTRASRPGAVIGPWAVYPADEDPRLLTSSAPARAGLCVGHEVQRLVDGTWRDVRLSPCQDTDDAGVVRHALDVRHPAGSRFRVRAVRDSATRTEGSWAKVRFR